MSEFSMIAELEQQVKAQAAELVRVTKERDSNQEWLLKSDGEIDRLKQQVAQLQESVDYADHAEDLARARAEVWKDMNERAWKRIGDLREAGKDESDFTIKELVWMAEYCAKRIREQQASERVNQVAQLTSSHDKGEENP